MHVFIVVKVSGLSTYDADMGYSPEIDILLATHSVEKANDMVALAKRLGVQVELREVAIE